MSNDGQFRGVAAPAPAEPLQLAGRGIGLHRSLGQGQADDPQFGGDRNRVQGCTADGGVHGQGPLRLVDQFEQPGLDQTGRELVRRGGVLAEAVGQQGTGTVEVTQLQGRHGVGGTKTGAPFGGKLVHGRSPGVKGLPGRLPVTLGRGDIASPDRRGRVGSDSGGGEIALGFFHPADQGACGTAQAAQLRFTHHARGLGDDTVQDTDRLIAETGTHQEPGKGEACLGRCPGFVAGGHGFLDRRILETAVAGGEAFFTDLGPLGQDQGGVFRPTRRVATGSRRLEGSRRR